MDITVFELHAPNAEFYAPYAGRTSNPDSTINDPPSTEETDSSGQSKIVLLVFLLVIGGLAGLAHYLRHRS